jgi:hypothetical protein
MRRIISATAASALLAAGVYISYVMVAFGPHPDSPGKINWLAFMSGVVMTILGGVWLWDDFFGPDRPKGPGT